jgi:hypothetical protein
MKHFEALMKLPGAVIQEEQDRIWDNGVRHPSPSFNWIFGNTNLAPFGSSIILWGGSKSGKSIILNGLIGQLHKDYDDAVAIKYNTEFREKIQTTALQKKIWGIDPKRYAAYETNRPEEIFDVIERDIPALIQKGLNIKLIAIDSISDILGRRQANSDTVEKQQIGDEAQTIKDGLKRIKATIKRYGITLVLVAQERAELDTVEQMRGKKVKMAGASYLKHFAEYFVHVSKDESASGKVDLMGNSLTLNVKGDLTSKDNSKGEQFGHAIKFKMQDSTVGPKGRVGRFTLDYYKGIINTHEEVFLLGVNRNVVKRPNNRTYILEDFPNKGESATWSSKEDFINAIKENNQVSEAIMQRIRERDIAALREGIVEEISDTGHDEGDDTKISFDDELDE